MSSSLITTIWRKDIRSLLYTWKSTLWLVLASLIFSVTSYLLLTNKELSLLDQTELLWLFGKIIVGAALLIVAIDASTALTTEFEQQTAESLFLSPLRLRDLLLGKLLTSLTLWGVLLVVAAPYMVVTAAGTRLAPAFVGYIALFGTLGVIGLVLIILGLGMVFRSSRNTLSTALILILGLSIPALFASTLKLNAAAQLFARINPLDNIFAALDNVLVDSKLSLAENWIYFWPVLLFVLVGIVVAWLSARVLQRRGIIQSE
jgi:ABC-2 type transport system permease protein